MKKIETPLKDLYILEPQIFGDERGYFYEAYNEYTLEKIGIKEKFIQDNHSLSQKGVLRGMHYQLPPYEQVKLLRVTRGSIWDVVVDMRKNSPTYLQWHAEELSADNKKLFYVPAGFAHGFCVLSDVAELQYKVDKVYAKEYDRSIQWNDEVFKIDWPIEIIDESLLSDKDKKALTFIQAEEELSFFY